MMEEELTEPDMEAAQQLVQLTGGEKEESKGLEHSDSQKKKKEKKKKEKEEEGRAEISGGGKEEEVEEEDEHRLRKRKRHRSLASIYESSKPISSAYHGSRKKRSQRGREKGLGD